MRELVLCDTLGCWILNFILKQLSVALDFVS